MLQLVTGIAGAGKTAWIKEQLAARAGEGKASLLLVPEQFSSSAESMVYHALGDAGSAFVDVVSFRTLAERIFKTCGAPEAPVLDEAARLVLVRRALDAVADQLKVYARHRRSAAFCAGCAAVIDEFKTAGATPATVREVGRMADEEKLGELALVFEAYEALLQGVQMDPQDKVSLAAERADCGFFSGKALYVDDFDGFTAPEYALLTAAMQEAEQLCVALCCDGLVEIDGGLGRFSPVRKVAARLRVGAQRAGVGEKAAIALWPKQGEADPAPYALNRLIALGEEPEEGEKAGITLTGAADEWEEVRLVAAEIRRLAEEGVPFSDIAVICRDVADYEVVVRRQFSLYGIPYHTDVAGTVEYSAPVRFLRAALALLRGGMGTEPVLALLKTGLCGYSEEDLAAVENYVFTWAPKAKEWREGFTQEGEGLLGGATKQSIDSQRRAERVRGEVVPRLEGFLKRARGAGAAQLTKELYLLMDAMGAVAANATTAAALDAAGETALAETTRRAWDITMDLLDKMALLLEEEAVSADGYDELFLLLVRGTEFGRAPQTLECVVFTSADRMRLEGVRHSFVLGLCEGEFPKGVGWSGLLTHTDRDLLVEGGIQMPGSFENRTLLEEMVFYRAMASAHETIHLSWPSRRGGAVCAITSALQPVVAAFSPPPLRVETDRLAATPAAAFELLGETYRTDTPGAAALYKALENRPDTPLHMLDAVDNGAAFRVRNRAIVKSLVGEEMQLSPTRAERYFECRFSYYMERVLRVKPRRKAELSPLESGTFVHYLLEKVLAEAGEGFKSLSDEALEALAQAHAEAFLQELELASRRAEVLMSQILAATVKLLCYLRDGAAQSDFEIEAVELEIGDGPGAVPPLVLELPTGERVRVVGKVDRLDIQHRDGKQYLCIIDYKTGTKRFDLAEVWCGLNMQMMIYMHTLLKNGTARWPNAVPAGVLYLSGDPAPKTGERGAAVEAHFELDGVVLDDPDVLRGLDKTGAAAYLPVRHRDGKPLRAGAKVADLEKLGKIAQHVEGLLGEMAAGVYSGEFEAVPLVKKERRPCQWCGYRAVCRHEDGRAEREIFAPEGAFEQDTQ